MTLAVCLLALSWPARAQNSLQKVRDRGVLIVGTDATYPPFEFIENGRFRGFDIDLGREIGRELGVQTRFENIAWDGIFAALHAWNDFIGPLIYLQDESKYTLAIGLTFFRSQYDVQFNLLMAASTLIVLPVVVIFLLFQRAFLDGITLGSVK